MILKYLNKKIVVLFCMDIRLIEFLFKVMNLKNGDVKLIKNVGVIIMYFFGSIMRSVLVVIYEFDVDEVMVVGYYGCGMCNVDMDKLFGKILDRGIFNDVIFIFCSVGIDIK